MKFPSIHNDIKPKRRREIYEDVAELSQPGGPYYVMVALSTVIAAYGLLINSAAVVVGAMLVAPLMGPIFGIALALASGSRRLLWPSLQSEIIGVFIAVAFGGLIGLASFEMPMGSEWLVRSQPTLYDLVIALASGLAGAYALVDERMSPALPGVAVSVAVLPPLAACGLALANGRWGLAGGAMLLFVANFFAIQIAAAIVFSVFGMLRVKRERRSRPEEEEGLAIRQFFKRFGISILVLVVMGWFMTNTLLSLAADRKLAGQIEETLSSSVSTASGARLSDTNFEETSEGLRVTATVMAPAAFEQSQVADMEESLENRLGRTVHLIVRSLISRDMDRDGAVFTSATEEELEEEERRRIEFLQKASNVISAHIRRVPGAELADLSRRTPNGTTIVTAVVRAPEVISPQQASEMEQALRRALGRSIKLVVRTISIRDATAGGFLHEQADEATARRQAITSTTKTVLQSWLSDNLEGARVVEVTAPTEERPSVVVCVLTPEPLTEEHAAAMETQLQNATDQPHELVVRYRLGAEIEPPSPEPAEPAPETEGPD